MNTKKTGFTLIELLVVIAIIGVLSGVVMQSISSTRIKSRDTARLTAIDQINKALELAATGGTNAFPSTATVWICLGLSADTNPACGGTADATHIANTTIQNNLANKIIPRDPHFQNGIGTAYLYNSSVDPDGGGTALSSGAYLSWVKEVSGSSCARGSTYTVAVTNGTQCFLRIGSPI